MQRPAQTRAGPVTRLFRGRCARPCCCNQAQGGGPKSEAAETGRWPAVQHGHFSSVCYMARPLRPATTADLPDFRSFELIRHPRRSDSRAHWGKGSGHSCANGAMRCLARVTPSWRDLALARSETGRFTCLQLGAARERAREGARRPSLEVVSLPETERSGRESGASADVRTRPTAEPP